MDKNQLETYLKALREDFDKKPGLYEYSDGFHTLLYLIEQIVEQLPDAPS